ncbi:ADP-ribosyl cyclase/cyclic ADP-ribose hydrolase-like [Glandiceps talaboti]
MFRLFLYTSIVCVLELGLGCATFSGPGTPLEFRELFIGRCIDFTSGGVNPNLDLEQLRDKNCTKLWELLFSAFAYREPCDVTVQNYEPFMKAAAHDYPANTALFWSGYDALDIVMEYGFRGNRRTSLDRTLMGYSIGFIRFCGSTTHPSGMDFTACPTEWECGSSSGAVDAFWAMASIYFAEYAKGDIKIFLYSNRPGGALHFQNRDTCSTDSIIKLKQILTDKKIPHSCSENPRDVLLMLCIDHVEDEHCIDVQNHSLNDTLCSNLPWTVIMLLFVVGFATFSSQGPKSVFMVVVMCGPQLFNSC